jgi:hypothetical protein
MGMRWEGRQLYAAVCTDTDTACPSAANAASSCSSREAWSSRNRRSTDSRFQRSRRLSSARVCFAELPVKLDLEHRQGRQAHKARPALMTLGNVVTVSHAGYERFLDRADRAPQRIGLIFAKGCHFGQRRAGGQDRVVVVRHEVDPIAQHYFSPRSLRILFTKPLPSSLRLLCMGNWDFRSSRRTEAARLASIPDYPAQKAVHDLGVTPIAGEPASNVRRSQIVFRCPFGPSLGQSSGLYFQSDADLSGIVFGEVNAGLLKSFLDFDDR